MSRKTLLTLAASALLGVVIAAPNAALAQFGPPPGPPPMLAGPPPGLGAGGPPPGLGAGPVGGPPAGPIAGLPSHGPVAAPQRDIASGPPRLEGAGGLHGLDRGGQANFRDVEGRAAAYSANSLTRNSYASYWPWLPALALCGGCGLRLWRILCLLRRRLLLRVHLQAIRHQKRSGLSWKLIEAKGRWRPGLAPGRRPFGRTRFACTGWFSALDNFINKLYGLV
jgi:hypothetical protein